MTESELITIPERIKSIYNSCTDTEREYLQKILIEISEYGYSETYEQIWLSDYKEIPVDIDTFITSDTYLGKTNRQGDSVYPFWRKELRNIFNAGNKYHEVIFTGATRIGKSSTGITAAIYMLYRLMCLRDPQKFFNKKDVSIFSILFFNITKDLARGVAYREFNDTLKESPWFNAHGHFSDSEQNFYYIPEGGKISIDYGSDAAHGLGKQVFVAFMDECNFSKAGVKDINKAKAHMKNTYDTLTARVKGTFKHGGEVFGKIFAISSKNSDSSFMEDHIQVQKNSGGDEHMYVSDAPQWEVLPPSTFSKEKFPIAIGNQNQRGFVVPDNQTDLESIADLEKQGFKILWPPVDMKSDFLADFHIALRDLAGIAVVGALSFITKDTIVACINYSRKNPFYNDIIQIGVKDNHTLEEFFHMEAVDPLHKRCPLYIHLDLSLNTDKTGISGIAITGRKDIEVLDENGHKKTMSVPTYTHIFSVSLQAPRGDKIPYDKITKFICWLRGVGFNIERISRDQFQSEYMGQLLEAQGFTVDKISVDRTPDGYTAFRSILLEDRIDMLEVQQLINELIHLERDSLTGKIDHPVGGCFTDDTKIQLVDGRCLTIRDLLIEQTYRTNWVYTFNEKKRVIEPKPIKKVFQTKIVKELIKVTLDNGRVIYCTPEHRFMLRDGTYEEIQNLCPGTSLMPLYTKISKNGLSRYRLYYEPIEDCWHYEHRRFCSDKLPKGWVVHHCDYNKLNNNPTNLKEMSKSKHTKLHNNQTKDYSKISKSVKDWHNKNKGTEVYSDRCEACRNGIVTYLKSKNPDYISNSEKEAARIQEIESTFGICWNDLSIREKNAYGVKFHRLKHPEVKKQISDKLSQRHKEGKFRKVAEVIHNKRWATNGVDNIYVNKYEALPEGFWYGRTISEETKANMKNRFSKLSSYEQKRLRELHSKNTSNRIWVTDGVDDKYILKDTPIPKGFHRGRSKCGKNHKILSIEYVHKVCRVYDLEIEDNHNFALDAGVFVHNSKDMADSVAGALWNATLHNAPITISTQKRASVAHSVNAIRSVNGITINNNKPTTFSSLYNKYK